MSTNAGVAIGGNKLLLKDTLNKELKENLKAYCKSTYTAIVLENVLHFIPQGLTSPDFTSQERTKTGERGLPEESSLPFCVRSSYTKLFQARFSRPVSHMKTFSIVELLGKTRCQECEATLSIDTKVELGYLWQIADLESFLLIVEHFDDQSKEALKDMVRKEVEEALKWNFSKEIKSLLKSRVESVLKKNGMTGGPTEKDEHVEKIAIAYHRLPKKLGENLSGEIVKTFSVLKERDFGVLLLPSKSLGILERSDILGHAAAFDVLGKENDMEVLGIALCLYKDGINAPLALEMAQNLIL